MILRRLLPNALAWRVTTEKQLRQFLAAFDILETDSVAFFDAVYDDLSPVTTRQLDRWDLEFGLPELDLPEADRRERLAAAWQAVGGQDPRYIQDTLQAAGFDVYVHEWWEPGTEPPMGTQAAATPRNPLVYLQQTFPGAFSMVDCGEALAECGEVFAESGNGISPPGYPLVNKVPDTPRVVPNDPALWPFFLYIGGETFGTLASVDSRRRDEFETLCLKICPVQLWLGMLVQYA